jgi:vancomycin resistance protein YoaR
VSSGATSVSGTARRRFSQRPSVRRAALAAGGVCLLAVVGASLFAGSPTRLAEGTTVAGLDVGGLGVSAARARLLERADALAHRPVAFVARGRTFELTPSQLGVRPEWGEALRRAAQEGDGIAPLRGLRRIQTRLLGAEVDPHVDVYPSAVRYTLARIAAAVDRPAASAKLRRRGLSVAVVPERAGLRLDQEQARALVVSSLASLERHGAVRLPVVVAEPEVTASQLDRALTAARTALSRPVTLTVGATRFRLPRWRVAQVLDLPSGGGETRATIGGAGARRWIEKLSDTVGRKPRDATFRVVSGAITVVPSQDGRALDVDASLAAIQRAAFSPTDRSAALVVRTAAPERTTQEAEAMGITGVVGSYTTTYGGTEGRLHNVALVAELIDGALVAPGARFSFNATTGERNAAKGFEEAPVIINGELESGIGGGVCQVSTTVFNAAFEAGLSIEKRTNHALYISHYPLGRDATVNYPDLDLVFRNDTDRWLLLRTFVGTGSLTVNLYGTPTGRRVETETAPLVTEGKVPWKRIDDDSLYKGEKVVEQYGTPPRSTSVRRRVFAPDGKLMYDTTWHSYYVGEPTVVRIGTKQRPKKPPKATPPEDTTKTPPVGQVVPPTTETTAPTAPTTAAPAAR